MIHLVRMHLMNKNEKRISQHFLIKFASNAQTCISQKAMPTSKTETKFIVLLPPQSLKYIVTHLVILSKHVLPDLHLTLTASRYYTQWKAAIQSTYSEQHSYPEQYLKQEFYSVGASFQIQFLLPQVYRIFLQCITQTTSPYLCA